MAKHSHLSHDQRDIIHQMLNQNCTFTQISLAIQKDRTTIAKEIKRNRYVKDYIHAPFSQKGIKQAEKQCDKLSHPPYCCNGCKLKSSCMLKHLFYNAKKAQEHYKEVLTNARVGVDITEEEIAIINKNIVPLVKYKKQSVNQIFINHSDILYFSKVTFYKYVNDKIIDLDNLSLPKKVKYKKRKKDKNKENKRDLAILQGRRYEDFLLRIEKEKKLHIWQLDTVIVVNEGSKVLMTFLMQETNFMIIRLLDKKNVLNVDKAFTNIKKDLSIPIYQKYIDIILTDNGSEFYDPIHMEIDLDTGEKLCSVYYCHPNSPNEKAELEKNHEYIRKVLPKGSSFDNLTEEDIQNLENHINNIPREILGAQSPYQLVKEKYPELINGFHSQYIEPDYVSLNPDDIISTKKQK